MKRMIVNVKKNYEIVMEEGLLDHLEVEVKKVYEGHEIFIITDERVAPLYLERAKNALSSYVVHSIVIKGHEESKTLNCYEETIETLISQGIRRNHLFVALGGGVIGDLTGFIAGTLYRGIPYIQIPTTLLSQTDSSIGGKTGINLKEGKNLLGVFNQPLVVLIDPLTLVTLPKREYLSGLAELVKHGLIMDETIITRLEEKGHVTEDILFDSINVKNKVVSIDEFDTGLRMILNFGHTFGHAIEKKGNFETYTHGEAVEMGMRIAVFLGEMLGITEEGTELRVNDLFDRLGFEPNTFDIEELLPLLSIDKKNLGGILHLILLKKIGETVVYPIKEEEINDLGGKIHEHRN